MRVKQQLGLNHSVVFDNFSDYPERIVEIMPVFDKLVKVLREKGYEVSFEEDYGLNIPGNLTVTTNNPEISILDLSLKIRDDFLKSCRSLSVDKLFES